jgi:hypothetical protein
VAADALLDHTIARCPFSGGPALVQAGLVLARLGRVDRYAEAVLQLPATPWQATLDHLVAGRLDAAAEMLDGIPSVPLARAVRALRV